MLSKRDRVTTANEATNIAAIYLKGFSITEVSEVTGISLSTVRFQLKKLGVLRTRGDGVRLAADKGRLSKNKGVTRPPFSSEWKSNISSARRKWGEKYAAGISVKASGYVEITRGKNKGVSIHVAVMEEKLGRKLDPDECVHHIDGNRANNSINNLALMTRSGHTRHHRMIERITKWRAQ